MANALVVGASGKYVGQDLVGEAAGAPPAEAAGNDVFSDVRPHHLGVKQHIAVGLVAAATFFSALEGPVEGAEVFQDASRVVPDAPYRPAPPTFALFDALEGPVAGNEVFQDAARPPLPTTRVRLDHAVAALLDDVAGAAPADGNDVFASVVLPARSIQPVWLDVFSAALLDDVAAPPAPPTEQHQRAAITNIGFLMTRH